MPELIHLGELPVQVFRKKIKNLHLSVLPPDGRVRISAPEKQSLERIKAYAVTKLPGSGSSSGSSGGKSGKLRTAMWTGRVITSGAGGIS